MAEHKNQHIGTTIASAHQIASPDAMRRTPKQLRSRRMVNAIVDAARTILHNEGREALSTTSLELVSGVSKASIYQYFPNLEAVVAEVFHDVIRQRITDKSALPSNEAINLRQFVELLVDSALDLHKLLLSLDRGFYRSYSGYYDLWQAFDEVNDGTDVSVPFLKKQLERCTDYQTGADTRLHAYALGRTIELTTYAMLRDDPDFLSNPKFRHILIGVAMATVSS